MIKFENVSKRYQDDTVAVESLNLEIKKGEFFVLIGPSGCGKTTTLKMINRLIPLSDGTIFIDGKKISEYDIHELRWNIGYVLQQIALFPHMTIEENIMIVPEMKRWDKKKMGKRVDELLEMVGLEPEKYKNRKPNELSGGQQQRVGVIRALAADPEIVIMDEPFSALDPISREKLQDDLIKLQKDIKKTIVFVTHDIQEAFKLADRIALMKDGEIVQIGTPNELLHHPNNEFVKEFIGGHGESNDPEHFQIEQAILALNQDKKINGTIAYTSTLQQVLEALLQDDQLGVEKEGDIIGVITKDSLIQSLASSMKAGVRGE
ncbi:ABC transporter ATP-binding protein [Heyndrickxia sp. NPDC080065]|uniref:ABC transporter ATP-binding protein n=1 Tax=Heyndrickxia sp. NPDC080065 TaxID=3390568 RepID=UPI003D08F282